MPPPSTQKWSKSKLKKPPTAKDDMKYMPSISRSGGLDPGGDALSNHLTQEKYRIYIQEKLDAYQNKFLATVKGSSPKSHLQQEAEHNVLIMFRKLREGILSSKRRDAFAIEVYETSGVISVLFDERSQASPILQRLAEELYNQKTRRPATPPGADNIESALSRLSITNQHDVILLLYLLNILLTNYPSQYPFYRALGALTEDNLSPLARRYVSALAANARRMNYTAFSKASLPSGEFYIALSRSCFHENKPGILQPEAATRLSLPKYALDHLLQKYRERIRESIWKILRTSYREIALDAAGEDWLGRTLLLDRDSEGTARSWLALRDSSAAAPKEGSTDKWVVLRARH